MDQAVFKEREYKEDGYMNGLKPFLDNMTSCPAEKYFRKIIRDWGDKYVIPYRRQYDEDWKDHKFIEPAFKALLVDLGFQKSMFPPEYGGWNLGQSDFAARLSAVIFEEVSRFDAGMAVALGVVFWPIMIITWKPHIHSKLCDEFAPMYMRDDKPMFGMVAMTEPQGGSDIENLDVLGVSTIKTTAVLDGDEWVINGHKLWPTNSGGVADLIGVICTTKPGSDDEKDLAYIFVPADTPGVTQGNPYEKAGMASDKNSDIWFEDVRVPSWYRPWGPGLDALYFRGVLTIGMLSPGFSIGPMLNVYEILYDFCSKKTLNGKPLKEHDAIAGELAEIVTGIETSRALYYRFAYMLDHPQEYGWRWAPEILARGRLAKNFIADRCIKDCERAMEIMGTYGADRQWDIEKHWRDLKMGQLYEGGKQLALMDTARPYFDCKTL